MANQKFPEVGLRAVFELTGFMRGYRQYQTMMRDVDRTTQSTSRKINQEMKGMTADIARSFADFSRTSTIVQDIFDNLNPTAQIAEMQRLGEAFRDLGPKAQVNVGIFDHLVNSGISFSDAMRVAGGQIQFNLPLFDRLVQKGRDANEAFSVAASGASGLGGEISLLGRSFSIMAVAVTASVAAIKVGIAVVRESVSAYTELAEATRKVSYQTGLLTREASGWVTATQAAGLSTATAERGMASFLKKASELRAEQAAGEQSTSDFARAMGLLQVSVTDAQGNLKGTADLMEDVNQAFQRLGPGAETSAAATALFGYAGRQLLPILTDQEQSLADLTAQGRNLGAEMTSLDKKNYANLRRANIRLQQTFQGIKLEIARGWIPAIAEAKEALADFINAFRELDARARAFSATINALASGQIKLADATRYYGEQLQFFLGLENEAARAAEESAQAQANAAQAIAASERDIREEREKTLRQLDELKDQLNQKLDAINQDAAQKWDDILVQRQRDAFDRALQQVFRMEDLRQAYNERMDAIERDFAKRWEDILVNRQRDAIERGIRLAWRYEDLERQTQRAREGVLRDFAEREVEIRENTQKRIREAEKDARDKREKLERDHRRRLAEIQQDFLDTVSEAARDNDAVSVARAMRERARELRDAEARYQDEQRDLEDSLRKKREQINQDRREREQDHKRELQRALQRIEENHQRQLEDIARQQDRERQIRELRYQWELEDFNKAKAEQEAAAQEWYDKQLEEMEEQQAREALLREIAYERQEIDFVKAWQRRIDDARGWYQKERDELAHHLGMTGDMLEQAYAQWQNSAVAAANAVSTVMSSITANWASEIQRYQHTLSEAQRQYATTTGLGVISFNSAPSAPRVPQAPVIAQGYGFAEGGVFHASGPTHVMMGEAGPETAVFLPGNLSSLNVNHSFGQLGVDFQGLPGGMNTQQVQSIVYAVVTQLAKGIQMQR